MIDEVGSLSARAAQGRLPCLLVSNLLLPNRLGRSARQAQPTLPTPGPVYRFCHERGLTCEWDLLASVTTNEDLRHRVRDTTQRLDDMQVLADAMQFGSDQTSSLLLAKLWVGVSVFNLAQSVRNVTGTADQYGISLYPESE
jgi:hypothetical protein